MTFLRSLASSAVHFLLSNVATRFLPAPRVIYDRDGVSPYLSRYYLRGRPHMKDGSNPFNEAGNPKADAISMEGGLPHVYLHYFHRGDNDDALHNHPWAWSFSFILSGGYIEERRRPIYAKNPFDRSISPTAATYLEKYEVYAEEIQPFTFNYINGDDYHRVDLLDERKGAWTLFVVGPRVASWNFWDRFTGEVTHWREFINRRRTKSGGPMVEEKPEHS